MIRQASLTRLSNMLNTAVGNNKKQGNSLILHSSSSGSFVFFGRRGYTPRRDKQVTEATTSTTTTAKIKRKPNVRNAYANQVDIEQENRQQLVKTEGGNLSGD